MFHVLYGKGTGRAARPFSDKVQALKFAKKVNGVVKTKIGYRSFSIIA